MPPFRPEAECLGGVTLKIPCRLNPILSHIRAKLYYDYPYFCFMKEYINVPYPHTANPQCVLEHALQETEDTLLADLEAVE